MAVNLDIRTPNEILFVGLELMGWAPGRIKKAKQKTNHRRFRCHFGCHPLVLATLYEDLQTTMIPEARVGPAEIDIDDF